MRRNADKFKQDGRNGRRARRQLLFADSGEGGTAAGTGVNWLRQWVAASALGGGRGCGKGGGEEDRGRRGLKTNRMVEIGLRVGWAALLCGWAETVSCWSGALFVWFLGFLSVSVAARHHQKAGFSFRRK